jgi:four helix bundle protein
MEYVKSFRDLEVYKLSREVSKEIFILSKNFPREEKYSLIDQMRRSSRSVGALSTEYRILNTEHQVRILSINNGNWKAPKPGRQ